MVDFHQDHRRCYLRCLSCCLVFVPPPYHLSPPREKAEYDLHRNSPEDGGYRLFLSRLYQPLRALLPPGSLGLDFGSGPGPGPPCRSCLPKPAIPWRYMINSTLRIRLYSRRVRLHHRHRGRGALVRPPPGAGKNVELPAPGGWLGIMTKLVRDRDSFARWHYKNDPTHVSFFARATFARLAAAWGAGLTFADQDVILFRKDG